MTSRLEVTNEGGLRWIDTRGRLHREGDLPALIDNKGNVWYWREGQYHRDGSKPAVVLVSGYRAYYKFGMPWYDPRECK